MPWTPAQRRYFGYQYSRGEISREELKRRMAEGVRTDVDESGHARKTKKRKTYSRKNRGRG